MLIPKVKHPEKVTQYRLISLCNFNYKVIAKILANRLKPLIGDLISEWHNAFIPGRAIQDNIIIAHEYIHTMKKKSKGKNSIIVIKLEWSFLEVVIRKMGFNEKWIWWIMNCVSTISYLVLIRSPSAFFHPSRGLRQGNPLSPYLFLFVTNALSNFISASTNH